MTQWCCFPIGPRTFSLAKIVEENPTPLHGRSGCFREHFQKVVVFDDDIQEANCMKFLCCPPELHGTAHLCASFPPGLSGIQPKLLIKLNGSNYLFHNKKWCVLRELEIEQLEKTVD